MATTNAPQFRGPDGVLRTEFIFSTDLAYRFFEGVTEAATVDMQVSIRGAAFTSDPDLILFEGTQFTIPNPSAFPNGLALLPGDNRIEVRAVLSNGETTPVGVVDARLSPDRDVKAGILAPSGIYVERMDSTVRVTVEGIDDPNVQGYNFYASTAPGGGVSGYYRLNPSLVISGDTVEEFASLGELTVDARIATDEAGDPAADPLYLRFVGTQTDRLNGVLQTDFNQALVVPETTTRVRTTISVDSVRQIQRFSFVHDRRSNASSTENPAIPNSDFLAIPEADPLYYTVTAVYLIDEVEYESVLSPEVAAAPLNIQPGVSLLPTVTGQQITRDTVLSIYRSQPELSVEPGAVLRDTFIDPFSTEAERIRFIIGFLQAAQTFGTLLLIDDPGNSGESIPVSQSAYKLALKQAFFLKDDLSTQNLVDNAFDALASRYGESRKPGQRARGELTCYTTARPQTTRSLPLGSAAVGGGQRFRFTSAAAISPEGSGSVYNPATGRYSARVFIQAEQAGEAGNLAPGQITTLADGPSGVMCINEARTFGGRNLESNRELAIRVSGALSAVDSGRYRGYVQTAIDTPGVLQVMVVDAGHPLMIRDYDTSTKKHKGGMVDVWVRGENPARVTDDFAFSFEIVQDGHFEPVGALSDLRFRAVGLTESTPLIEMLNNPSWGFDFRDETTGKAFDLTDVTVIFPDGIQLSPDHNTSQGISLTDVFRGSYRFRTSDRHVFTRQPVSAILSLVGDPSRSGTISPTVYRLFPGSDPLDLGRSPESGDYVQVVAPLAAEEGVVIPSGDPIVVTGEDHVLLEGAEYLNNLGINPVTVRIYNADRSVEYNGPYHPDSVTQQDFEFVPESGDTPLGFRTVTGSRLSEGDTLLVDYEHDENFVVSYQTNSLIGVVQESIDAMRHVTADVLTKDSIAVGVDIQGTIVMVRGQTRDVVDSAVRTSLSRLFGSLYLGQALRQSDIIGAIEELPGVSYVVTPLVELAKSDGSMVIREQMPTDRLGTDFIPITAWSTNLVDVYLLLTPLESGTLDGGGEFNESRGVFVDYEPFILYDNAPNFNGIPIKNSPNGAFIIGNDGMVIPGYSDDVTLARTYPLATLDQLNGYRQEVTQRRVLVALPKGESPLGRLYEVSYIVYEDVGVKNIEPGSIGYLVLGDLEFSYDEEPRSGADRRVL